VKHFRAKNIPAQRTAGSHSLWDVIAILPTEVKLIQVKRIKEGKYHYSSGIKEFKKLDVPENVSKELWVWKDREGFIFQERI